MTPRTVALFLPNWVGDVVMATPAIRAVRDHWPAAKLVAVCKPYVADTLGGNPWFDETVLFDRAGPRHRRPWAVAAKLRSLRADTAVLFPNSFRAALLARLGGCGTVAGFARYGRDALLTHRVYPARDHGGVKVSPAHGRLQPRCHPARRARSRATGWNCTLPRRTTPRRTASGTGSACGGIARWSG